MPQDPQAPPRLPSWFPQPPPSTPNLPLDPTPFSVTNPALSRLFDFLGGAIGINDFLDPKASNATLIGAAVGAGLPLVGAAVRGVRNAAGMTQRVAQPIRAYHGSPHEFERFDLSKIGTGEGAQAYGHGLYFAEKPATAAYYKDALSRQAANPRDGVNTLAYNWLSVPGGPRKMEWQDAASLMRDVEPLRSLADRKDIAENIAAFVNGHRELGGTVDEAGWKAMRYLERHLPEPPKGKMYEVNIHASPDDFLDWDKPLSQQSEKVKQALRQYYQSIGRNYNDITQSASGASIYQLVGHGDNRQAADALRKFGVKGIRYRDAGSRGGNSDRWLHTSPTGMVRDFGTEREASDAMQKLGGTITPPSATRNYVAFDDAIIEIMKKYGVTFPVAATVYHRMRQRQEPPR